MPSWQSFFLTGHPGFSHAVGRSSAPLRGGDLLRLLGRHIPLAAALWNGGHQLGAE